MKEDKDKDKDKSKTVQTGVTVLLLMFFMDVLHDSFKTKRFTYRTEPQAPVPESSRLLWKKRGYDPSATGVAFVRFDGMPKEYTYPAYFWSE